jgi:hypothetical protein
MNLLCQISQQLPNFPNGSCSTTPIGQSFSPGTAIIWVNAMWMMSLLLSLTSALFATLLQQWARKYLQMPQIPSEPKPRARVRSSLFLGTQQYYMYFAVETAPTLLHISVFLFFAGLVILFYTIHKAVAIIVSISVGIFVVAYVMVTIFPYIYHNCPYRTPMSNIWWYISHRHLLSLSLSLLWLFEQLHGCVVPPNDGQNPSVRQRILSPILDDVRDAVNKHRQRLKDGFRETIVQWALEASDNVDVKALAWWLKLPALAEESKAQDFLACVPQKMIVQLMNDPESKVVFSEHLLTLLRSCEPGSLVGLDENERKTRLLVCLHAINRIAQECVNPNSDIDVNFMRTNFANIRLMQAMWADSDPGIRVTSRSICALLARRLLSDSLGETELRWLEAVTGASSNMIFISNITDRDRMNLKAFVYGVLAHQGPDLPAEHATSFTETLAILMDAGIESPFNKAQFETQLSALLEQIERDATPRSTGLEVAAKIRLIFRDFLLTPTPAPAATQQP